MTEYNGFGTSTPPGLAWTADGDTYTLGQRFRVTADGLSCTKIRWYIPSGSPNATLTGIYVGLYEVGGDGTPLATAGPVTAVLDAWNEASITPVPLVNGADYIAGVLYPSGRYGSQLGLMPYDPPGPIYFYDGGTFDARIPPTLTYPSASSGTPWYGIDVTLSDGGGGPQTIAISLATEADTGRTLSHSKSRALGLGVEADTGRPLGHSKAKALGIASEADSALALGKLKGKFIGLATETDAGRALSHTKSRVIGLASETDSAMMFAVKAAVIVALGRATELDMALPLTPRHPIILAITRATEVDTALVLVAGSGYVDTDWVVQLIGFESSVRSTLSNSYVYVEVLSDLDVRGDTVEVALVTIGDNPTDASWKSATWTSDSTAARAVARAQIEDLELDAGDYMAWVRITHPPIRPVLRSGKVRVF